MASIDFNGSSINFTSGGIIISSDLDRDIWEPTLRRLVDGSLNYESIGGDPFGQYYSGGQNGNLKGIHFVELEGKFPLGINFQREGEFRPWWADEEIQRNKTYKDGIPSELGELYPGIDVIGISVTGMIGRRTSDQVVLTAVHEMLHESSLVDKGARELIEYLKSVTPDPDKVNWDRVFAQAEHVTIQKTND